MYHQSGSEPNIFNYFGIEPTKNYGVVKKAYRAKVQKIHPDRFPEGATDEDFLASKEAMKVLNDHWELIRNEEDFQTYCNKNPTYFRMERSGQTTFSRYNRYSDDVNEYMSGYQAPNESTIVPVRTGGYQFIIKTFIGITIVLKDISNDMSLGAFAEQIQKESGIPIEQQQLILAGAIFFDYNNPKCNDSNETLLNASYRCCGKGLEQATILRLVVRPENQIETSSTVKPNLPEPFVNSLQEFLDLQTKVQTIPHTRLSIFNPNGTKAAKAKVLEIIGEALSKTIPVNNAVDRLQQCLNVLSIGSSNSPLIEPLRQFVELHQNNPQLIPPLKSSTQNNITNN